MLTRVVAEVKSMFCDVLLSCSASSPGH